MSVIVWIISVQNSSLYNKFLLNLENIAWNPVAVLISVWQCELRSAALGWCIALQATLLFLLHVGAAAMSMC